MNFFRNLLRSAKIKETPKNDAPRNVKLLTFLNRHAANPSEENYRIVVDELKNGKSFLLLPSVNDSPSSMGWNIMDAGSEITLRSVIDMDGITTLLAFSDEESLMLWAKGPSDYKAIISQDLMRFGLEHNIYRIIINVNQRNMFLLEKDVAMLQEPIDRETKVRIGTPSDPLPKEIIGELVRRFRTISAIEEVFQYEQTKEMNFTLMIAFKLNTNSDAAKNAALNCVQESLKNLKRKYKLGIYFIEYAEAHVKIKDIKGSLFYSK